jgi:hypothetical protein
MIPIEQIRVRLKGIRPLMLSRGEAANPFDPQTRDIKRVSQKRKKTDEDHELLAYLQFKSACYFDPEIGIYLPSDNLFKCIQQGAAKFKESPLVKSCVIIKGFVGKELEIAGARLQYDGPQGDLDKLYKEKQFVSSVMGMMPGQKTRVLVTRPIFSNWQAEYQIEFTDLTKERIMDYLEHAGRMIGIGTWRPQHGLFMPELLK